jgi:hypothetical protein
MNAPKSMGSAWLSLLLCGSLAAAAQARQLDLA